MSKTKAKKKKSKFSQKQKQVAKWLASHPHTRKTLVILGYIFAVLGMLVFLVWLFFGRGQKTPPEEIMWGATYSAKAAEELLIDPEETYRAVVEDLKPEKLRLVAYWNRIEREQDNYDFSELDFQVQLAEENNIPYVIAVGRRTPRYPECHAPEWSETLSQQQQNLEVLEIIERTIERYDDKPLLRGWQVENEPFVSGFGICPDLDEEFYAQEVDFVRERTDKTVIATESGELSFWYKISQYPDIVGTTLYKVVVVNSTSFTVKHIFPAWYYRARANIMQHLRPQLQQVIIAELQAEPWGTKPLVEESDEFLAKTMNPSQFEKNIAYAEKVGFKEADFWGIEWWYYELQRGNDYYWERGKQQFR